MLDSDKELALLEEEFPRSRRAWRHKTSAELDTRILQLAATQASYLRAVAARKAEDRKLNPRTGRSSFSGGLDREFRPRGDDFRELPPMASFSMQEYVADTPTSSSGAASDQQAPPGAEKMLGLLEEATPQQWLDFIAEQLQTGDVEIAIYLLERYKMKFDAPF